jgi:hypothetical protein
MAGTKKPRKAYRPRKVMGTEWLEVMGLIERIGLGRVLELEQDHTPRKYTTQELSEIKDSCKAATRIIKNA